VVVVVALVVLVVGAVALAAWSDHRDRKLGIDPDARVRDLHRQRKTTRQRRGLFMGLFRFHHPRDDEPEPPYR
jgi:hypothetical protein